MKKLLILVTALTTVSVTYAQDESTLKVSGYLETYYGYDFNKPADNNRPGFVYSHNRHNEVNLNLGFIKGSYESNTVRANIALMAGTYTNANLSAETGVLKNIFEANAGIRLFNTSNLWLDAGIFSSHIGFESAISKDCWVLTRNISSENTPYYEAGAKLTYSTANGRLTASLLYLNGWQRITRQTSNTQPAGGLQLTWKPVQGITLNYSNYLGTEGADSVRVKRFYHNIYGIFQITERMGLIAGLDYGTQQQAKGGNSHNEVLSPVIIAQYKFSNKIAMAGRVEYYQDEKGVLISTQTPNGFKTSGYSLNFDYAPVSHVVLRIEGKLYNSKDEIFVRGKQMENTNGTITTGIAISF